MGLLLGGRLRCAGRLGRGLGLTVLAGDYLAAEGKCECKESDGRFREGFSHGLAPRQLRFNALAEDSLSKTEKLAKTKTLQLQAPWTRRFVNSGRIAG